MSASEANIGYGTTIELAVPTGGTYVYVAEATGEIGIASESTDQVDVTHFGSPNKTREFISGLTDGGELTFDTNFVPGSATDKLLISAKGKKSGIRVTFPNGCQMLANGNRQTYEKAAPIDDKMTGSLSFKIAGEATMTDPTAPRALVAPSIVGTAQVGVVLQVDSGMFAGADTLAYQWKVGGDAVSGQTGTTYVPVTGDIGSAVTCDVTASNDDFATTVATAATANVIAAA
ncbi:phage tail tube protein [Martelella soudanensis]|uniref:phage tail tube protein n=1 Tax=unclassified Martelella TaxID=2629616 RepID=UPI0015DE900B|nr:MULTISPECIES: phage tail tube protein [unclassified Martelella]